MEQNEKQAQEMYMEYQMLDQHIKKMQAQLEAITNQLMEAASTNSAIDELEKIKNGMEIFVPISSGIFVKAAIKDTSDLLVNVGAGAVVQKGRASAKKLVQAQIEEMKKIHERMVSELGKMAARAGEIEQALQKIMPQ
ncbi:MAG TPA: prefoldin subunit alpha [Candidatus Nanoarchaeia archaeon]|nr:prefoldin subunit alpha [Candidatus Nanoarchaeia archaeon]